MSEVTVQGLNIVYDVAGPTDAAHTIILIHGHPFNRSMWSPQVEALRLHYRVVTFDLRGYGQSDLPPTNNTLLEDFARDIAALMDSLHIPSAVIGGLSMGGQIAMAFYDLFPSRVRALILADTFAQLDTPENKAMRYRVADRLEAEGMAGYADEVISKMVCPATLENKPAVAQHVLTMMRTTPPLGAAAALRGRSERKDYTPLLAEIAVPTLVVVGDQDAYTPVPDAEYIHHRVPASELVVIEASGHMPNLEQPAVFNDHLLRFLRTRLMTANK
ncbi:MAG: alpha/beta hydrolase [Chloroflexota bacterium]|nr:MAG: alpha/beta hydrolase [Chloroflexota bacterium]